MASSAALWGDLVIHWKRRFEEKQLSLAAWLARRGAGLRKLWLCFRRPVVDPSTVLASLHASSHLSRLKVSGNPALGEAGAALALLQRLGGLQRLDLSCCQLLGIPRELSSLGQLTDLRLSSDASLGKGGNAAWEPLAQLTSLVSLEVFNCNLRSLPSSLSMLGSTLRELSVGFNRSLGCGGEATAWQPLAHLAALTRLNLRRCGLESLPHQMTALQQLADVDVSDNEALGKGSRAVDDAERGSFAPLCHLPALTRLVALECGLADVPPPVSCLSSLSALLLSHNPKLGRGSFQPLQSLGGLTQLVLGRCGLQHIPPELSAMGSLAELEVWYNPGLGKGGLGVLEPLQRLPALQRVDLSNCSLRGWLPQLTSLQAVGVCVEW